TFCEIKEIVDDNAIGARTVVAADLNGDGWIDLASASKDDDTVAWYPNDGTGHFPTKIVISKDDEALGAYSLVAADIDGDGHQDLVVASNGNDHVSLWRNDGKGNFSKTLIYDNADFVLSVTAVDFDRDGDLDVASASFFDGYIRWYENVDGKGYVWKNHTVYVGIQGHYVAHGDMDGDGDDDLIAVTHAENTSPSFSHKPTATKTITQTSISTRENAVMSARNGMDIPA
ncbi:fg-gap repeat protein (Partial), partial [Seminavis robusta]